MALLICLALGNLHQCRVLISCRSYMVWQNVKVDHFTSRHCLKSFALPCSSKNFNQWERVCREETIGGGCMVAKPLVCKSIFPGLYQKLNLLPVSIGCVLSITLHWRRHEHDSTCLYSTLNQYVQAFVVEIFHLFLRHGNRRIYTGFTKFLLCTRSNRNKM